MKKTKVLLSLGVCVAVLGATTTAFAADSHTTTEGSIEWIVPTDQGDVIKPELPEIIITPGEGSQSGGPLRLQHVPDFNFGKQEIKSGAQSFNPTLASYKFTGTEIQPGGNPTDTYYLPHFVQVTDERGMNNGWNLEVSATTFKNGTEELEHATITLNGTEKLSNSVYSETEIKDRVQIFANTGLVIPTDGLSKEIVMSTKDDTKATTTNGTKTSLVLSPTYDKNKLDYKATDLNTGVTFTKTKDDVAVLGTYTSTITWNLTDGK